MERELVASQGIDGWWGPQTLFCLIWCLTSTMATLVPLEKGVFYCIYWIPRPSPLLHEHSHNISSPPGSPSPAQGPATACVAPGMPSRSWIDPVFPHHWLFLHSPCLSPVYMPFLPGSVLPSPILCPSCPHIPKSNIIVQAMCRDAAARYPRQVTSRLYTLISSSAKWGMRTTSAYFLGFGRRKWICKTIRTLPGTQPSLH